MNYTVTKGKGNFELKITFDGKEWAEAVEKAYKKEAGRFKIAGFRKGKVPRSIIEKTYGTDVFHDGAVREIFFPAYHTILDEHKEIDPIDYPSLDFKVLDKGLEIIATIDVSPEFKLGKYTGLEIKKADVKVTDKDIDKYFDELRESRARQVEAKADHKIKNGDVANINFVGSVEGVEFPGGRADDYELEIGSNSFIDTFESQLVGKKKGDEINVNVTFPEKYHEPKLAGKAALFVVTINSIMQIELPTLDDDFAKDVSEYETMAELRKQTKKDMTIHMENENKKVNETNIIKEIVKNTKIELPEKMIERQLDMMMDTIETRLSQQGANLEIYAQYMNTTIEAIREQHRSEAEHIIKTRLIIDEVAKKEKIDVSNDDVTKEVERLAIMLKRNKEEFATPDRLDYIRNDLMYSKVVEFLFKNNKLV